MDILNLLRDDGITPKKAIGAGDREYSSPCPACRGEDRFRVWPGEGDGGKWWCRGCGKTGDSIQYLRDFRNMSYTEACEHLGKEPKASSPARGRQLTMPKWEPRDPKHPDELWRDRATKFFEYAVKSLWSDAGKDVLKWLRLERGFTEQTIKAFRLGWNPEDFWRDRAAWGLSEVLKDDGKPKKLWLPQGLVIPLLQGKVSLRLRIRRPEPGEGPRYYFLPGSSTQAMITGAADMPVIAVVESELDAILIHQEAEDLCRAIALGSSSMRPDSTTAEILNSAELILVALDADEAGARETWKWWKENFPKARRWPPIGGKDPGDMRKAGENIRAWVSAGIEEYAGACATGAPVKEEPEKSSMVKCVQCSMLTGVTCKKVKKEVDGISLLRDCQYFRHASGGIELPSGKAGVV